METGAVEVRSRTLISSMGSFGFCEKAFLHGDRLTPLTHALANREKNEGNNGRMPREAARMRREGLHVVCM